MNQQRHYLIDADQKPKALAEGLERHYTTDEIAVALRLFKRTVQDLFRGEPGTIVIGNHRPGRRPRTIIRVPESVFLRFKQRQQVR